LRKTGPVPDKPKPSGGGAPKAAAPVKKPPVFELQGKKWIVVIVLMCNNLVLKTSILA